MRARLAILIALMAMVSSVTALGSPAWSSTGPTLAQETEDEGGDESESGGTQEEEGEGEGSEGGEAAEETGPPWTYQMARIGIVLLVLTFLGVIFAYYRFVAVRRREGF